MTGSLLCGRKKQKKMRPKAAQKLWQRATVWRLSAFFRKDRTMGILSEIDMMNRDAEDDAFEVSSDSETVDSFSEEFEPVEPPKPKPQEEIGRAHV